MNQATTDIRHDWETEEARRLYDLPFIDLVFRAQTVHRKFNDPNEIQLCALLSIKTGSCAEDCAYCRKLEQLFLLPMQRNAEYGEKILLRMVSLSDFDSLIDFNGRSITTNEFAAQYDVSLTPTLVFLNANGVEMSEKLVGIWSEDFYGGFIDNRIDEAREKL